jgi:gamma-glutamyltranspeptidase/glutathione hydrolase
MAAAGASLAAPRHLAYGAVAASDEFGAAAAKEILREGGNAVDAAVATGFAEAVTYPEAGNIGGGGFMTVFFKGRGYFLDYRETAPAAASAGMYLDAKGEVVPSLSLVGNLAAGVPGSVRGFWEAHRRFGRLRAPVLGFGGAGQTRRPILRPTLPSHRDSWAQNRSLPLAGQGLIFPSG